MIELAIAVADAWQHKGVGTRLFDRAIQRTVHNRVGTLKATAFADNWRVLALLRSTTYPSDVRFIGAGLVSVRIRIDPMELRNAA